MESLNDQTEEQFYKRIEDFFDIRNELVYRLYNGTDCPRGVEKGPEFTQKYDRGELKPVARYTEEDIERIEALSMMINWFSINKNAIEYRLSQLKTKINKANLQKNIQSMIMSGEFDLAEMKYLQSLSAVLELIEAYDDVFRLIIYNIVHGKVASPAEFKKELSKATAAKQAPLFAPGKFPSAMKAFKLGAAAQGEQSQVMPISLSDLIGDLIGPHPEDLLPLEDLEDDKLEETKPEEEI